MKRTYLFFAFQAAIFLALILAGTPGFAEEEREEPKQTDRSTAVNDRESPVRGRTPDGDRTQQERREIGEQRDGEVEAARRRPPEEGEQSGRGRVAPDREQNEREARERETQGRNQGRDGHPGEREPEDRIHHLFEAAEHLELAGFRDEARNFRERAEHLRAELQKNRHHPEMEEIHRSLQQLHEMVKNLQKENAELRQKLENSTN